MFRHVRFIVLCLFLMEVPLNGQNPKSPENPPTDMWYCPYGKPVDEIVKTLALEMKQEYGLFCSGSGGRMPHDVEEIDVFFVSYQQSNIEKGRKIEVRAIQRLLHLINTNEELRSYLREYPFTHHHVGVSISFQTETNEHPHDGSMALVNLARGQIFYKTEVMRKEMSNGFADLRYPDHPIYPPPKKKWWNGSKRCLLSRMKRLSKS